eukprot:364708-Chlamydomonas_euryale.AAC.19
MVDNAHEVVEQGRTCAHAWLCACMHNGVRNSSMEGDLATLGSLITSDGWENINRAPLMASCCLCW